MSLKDKLIDWIETESLSGGRYEGNAKSAEVEESDDEITINNDSIGLFGGVFKMDPEHFYQKLVNGPFEDEVRDFCRENKLVPEEMTNDDYVDYLIYKTNADEKMGRECSPFGCGSDAQSDWTITYENDTPYIMYYGRY